MTLRYDDGYDLKYDDHYHDYAAADDDVNNYDGDAPHYQQHDHEAGSRLSADGLETLDQYLSSDNKYNGEKKYLSSDNKYNGEKKISEQ